MCPQSGERRPEGRWIGIDYGTRRIGIAVSDPTGTFVRPLTVIEGEEALCRYLDGYIPAEGVVGIVVGLPKLMDDSIGHKARETLAFMERLRARYGIEVVPWDERCTTEQAGRILREGGVRGAGRRRTIDKLAAQIILQSFRDACGRGDDGEPGGERGRS